MHEEVGHAIEETAPPVVPTAPRGTVDDLRALLLAGRPLLDVRAPVEFAKGAFPGAVNLPILSDAERHDIGVRYKQRGQDAAIALGAELLEEDERARRTAGWKAFADTHPSAAIYCFRGGLRSRLAQAWLAEAGVELPLVTGGYKAMRSCLIDELGRLCESLELQLVGGRTGVGKTLLIERLGRTVDLEGIARHRGSSFGALVEPQPGNIDFENRVTIELMRLEREAGPVWLEDEARLIGRVAMPEALVQAMRRAPLTILETTLAVRVQNCVADYVVDLLARHREVHGDEAGFEAYAAHHRDSLDRVRKRLGGDNYALASRLLEDALDAHRARGDTAAYTPFIELMLERYYDPMYDYQLESKRDRVRFTGDVEAILHRSGDRSGDGSGDGSDIGRDSRSDIVRADGRDEVSRGASPAEGSDGA